MRFGMSLDDALRTAMQDLSHLDDPYASDMNIVALDRDGNPGAASTAPDRSYVLMREDMTAPDELPRVHIPLEFMPG
jgi:hypothetical protein